jgi:segregation and condensation protein B
MTPTQKIIQTCLYEGGPVKKNNFETSSEISSEIRNLLAPLGLELIETKDHFEIALSNEMNLEISSQKIDDLKTDLSESALQTLTVILYKPGSTKPEIDFIRGVDSVRSIKSLLTRGLIYKNQEKNTRQPSPFGKNSYFPSTETLKFLGLQTVENLPNFPEINAKLTELITG